MGAFARNTRRTQASRTAVIETVRARLERQAGDARRRGPVGMNGADGASAMGGQRGGRPQYEAPRPAAKVGTEIGTAKDNGGESTAARSVRQRRGGGGERLSERTTGGMTSPDFRIGIVEARRDRGPEDGERMDAPITL
jgi:hypothetical protein